MSRLYKSVLWTLAICVLGYFAVTLMIVEAPKSAKAQPLPDPQPLKSPSLPAPAKLAEPAVDGQIVIYSVKSPDVIKLIPQLQEKFSGKANIFLDERTSGLVIRASEEVHADIRAALSQLNDPNAFQPKATWPLAEDPFGRTGGLPEVPAADGLKKGLGTAEHQRQISHAVKVLREAKSEDESGKAKDHLRQLLASAFAADMAARQQQAAEIEARLSKLRDQYRAREELKDEIIDLQLKALALAAAGVEEASNATGTYLNDKGPPGDNRFGPRSESDLIPFEPLEPLNKLSASSLKRPGSSNQARSLADLKKTLPAVVNDLTKLGHFMESPDGKFYVYVNSNHPHGPSHIRVVDSATGKLIAMAMVPAVVGPLGLTDEGVVSQEGEGGTPLRIPWKSLRSSDAELDPGPTLPSKSTPSAASKTGTVRPGSAAGTSLLSQYNELRSQYETAKSGVAKAEAQFNARLAEVQKEQPEANLDDVKKQNAEAWNSVEVARLDFEAAKRLLETQLKLLELDRRAAMSAFETAKVEHERLLELLERKFVSPSEVDTQRAALQSAEINLERANTLHDLFKSLSETSVQTSGEPKLTVPGQAEKDPAPDPVNPSTIDAPKQ